MQPLAAACSDKSLNISGIYSIINRQTGDCYVGSSRNVRIRLRKHALSLSTGKHHSFILNAAVAKYGIEVFSVELLEVVDDLLFLAAREQFWLWRVEPKYNIAKDAVACHSGMKHTAETKRKIAEKRRGFKASAATCAKLSAATKGRVVSAKTRNKLSATLKGRKLPEHVRELNRKSMLQKHAAGLMPKPTDTAKAEMSKRHSGQGNPMYGRSGELSPTWGRKHSEDARKKISEKAKGRKMSWEAANARSKPLKVDGVVYASVMEASRQIGKDRKTIRGWLKTGRAEWVTKIT